MNDKTVKEILIDTRSAYLTNPDSWTKGLLVGNGCYCLLGAIGVASGLDVVNDPDHGTEHLYTALEDNPAVLHLASSIWEDYDVSERSPLSVVYGFNDDGDTDLDSVLAALDKAIATA
jgi:hypothetical protein